MALATSVASAVAAHVHSPFLDGLSAEELRVVLTAASERKFLANSVVLHANTPADLFFLLTSGRARHFLITPEGQKVLLLWLSPGSVFGGRTILCMESTYLLSTETVKDSRALVWDRQTIRDLMKRYPRLLDNSLAIASDYLTWCSAAHISMVCHDARQRFADVLVTLANSLGRRTAEGVEVDITNEELANSANVTLFTASRFMGEWHRSGAIKKSRGRVLLRSPERLLQPAKTQ